MSHFPVVTVRALVQTSIQLGPEDDPRADVFRYLICDSLESESVVQNRRGHGNRSSVFEISSISFAVFDAGDSAATVPENESTSSGQIIGGISLPFFLKRHFATIFESPVAALSPPNWPQSIFRLSPGPRARIPFTQRLENFIK